MHHNIRTWEPDDPDVIAAIFRLEIGFNARKGTDMFTIRVATPLGLSTLEDNDGIIADRPLLVMRRYDFDSLMKWVNETVAYCEAETWDECVENLRLFFNWEFDDYVEY